MSVANGGTGRSSEGRKKDTGVFILQHLLLLLLLPRGLGQGLPSPTQDHIFYGWAFSPELLVISLLLLAPQN